MERGFNFAHCLIQARPSDPIFWEEEGGSDPAFLHPASQAGPVYMGLLLFPLQALYNKQLKGPAKPLALNSKQDSLLTMGSCHPEPWWMGSTPPFLSSIRLLSHGSPNTHFPILLRLLFCFLFRDGSSLVPKIP